MDIIKGLFISRAQLLGLMTSWTIVEALAAIGLILSTYAYYVERKARRTPQYKPFCDFHANISCTKAFLSTYGHLSGVSNALLGTAFYALILLAVAAKQSTALTALATAGLLASLVLAYLSYVRQRNFCLVCSAVYVINIAIFILALR